MAMQKEEIMDLKTKCKHLEEVVAYYKNNTMRNEGENSVNYNKKNQPTQEQSVYMPWRSYNESMICKFTFLVGQFVR